MYAREVGVCVATAPERRGTIVFQIERGGWFSSCRRVTQQVREVRSITVGNTLLGNTVAQTQANPTVPLRR